VVPQKRLFIAAAGALVATLALAGCGSDDYGLSSAQSAAIGAAPAAAGADLAATEPAQEADVAEDDAAAEDNEAAKSDKADKADKAAEKADSGEEEAVAEPVGKVTNKLIATSVPRMGNVVTDSKGWVLYRFDKDKASPSKSNCVGDCAKLWPPLLADDTLELSGLSASKVDTVERADGGLQVTIAGWPVYRYIGDKKPGTWKGQNVGGAWFVIDKEGKKNLTCLPKISKPVKLPVDPAEKTKKASAKSDEVAATDVETDSSGY
jgi:predicted lipoprotein with Yx(FWY)xxD motif